MEGRIMEERDLKANETLISEKDPFNLCFGSAREVMDRYTHCALCGANLHFNHITDFAKNLTQEIARCPECGIKAREVMHKLQ
jgi:hypothetical protein